MKDELEPCPCCGWKRPDLKEGQRGSTKGVYLWCSSCGLTTRLFTYDPIITSGRTLAVDGARDAWNRRYRPPETPSPDVMEVWLDIVSSLKNAPVIPGDPGESIELADKAAANVIAEAKARWEREAFEKAAQVAERLAFPKASSAWKTACRDVADQIRALSENSQ